MTMPIQFDTAQYIKRLVEAGIPREHAEALADGLVIALSQPVAGEADLAVWRAEVQAMFTRSEAAMKEWVRGELARLEAELKAWLVELLERRDAEMKAWVMTKLRPLYWLHGINIAMSAIILAKLFL